MINILYTLYPLSDFPKCLDIHDLFTVSATQVVYSGTDVIPILKMRKLT